MRTQGSWILLPENRLAWQAVERVRKHLASHQSSPLNPLFLHGPPGSGKSRLLTEWIAILTTERPDLLVTVLSAADLAASSSTAEDTAALSGRSGADVLVVEDLQHLPACATAALEVLLDDARRRQRQCVITATQGPALLDELPGRLVSRLAQGLVCALSALGPESRRVFLEQRCRERELRLDPAILAWLVEHTPGSPRQLDGVLTRLHGWMNTLGRTPRQDELPTLFAAEASTPSLSLEAITRQVCGYFQVQPGELRGDRRSREVLLPRQVGMYLARQLTDLSLQQIGAYFGGRDHSTVLHACRKVEQALESDARVGGAVRQLRADLL